MTEDDFKKKLSPAQYKVLRQGRREAPFTGKYWDHSDTGTYSCGACQAELFSSKDKFDAGEGWPTFHKAIDDNAIQFKQGTDEDGRVEIRCKRCKSHLGYFLAGDKNYYRINSLSLRFEDSPELELPDIPEAEEKKEEEKEPRNAQEKAAQTMGSLSSILAGTLAGAVLGAGSAYLYCQSQCAPLMPLTSTSTSNILTPTTSTPRPATTTTPQGGSSSGSSPRPTGTSGAVQTQQSQLAATSSPAQDPADASADGSTGSADGTTQ